jgi:outer membrane protein TolC
LAEQLASKSYDMTLTRFGSGSVTAEILIDAQISLNQARHELLDSTIDYNIKAVKYKTMYFPPPLER